MNCKRLKYIMEMIFIFILPLVFILPNIKINNLYTYDSSGNFETSEKELIFTTPFSYIKEEKYINYLDFNQLINYNQVFSTFGVNYTSSDNEYLVSCTNSYTNDSARLYLHDFAISSHKYLITFKAYSTDVSSIYVCYRNVNITSSYNSYYVFPSSFTQLGIGFNYGIAVGNSFYIKDINVIDLTKMFGSGYEPNTIEDLPYIDYTIYYEYTESEELIYYSDDIISSNYVVNYTIWGKMHNLFLNYLDLNDSILLDLVMTYTILWIIMFIIWHLIYLLLDFLLHFWRKEDKS